MHLFTGYKTPQKNFFWEEEGMAEVVGALLMIAVISIAVGMLALIVLSGNYSVTNPSEKADILNPALRVGLINENGNIALIHKGGDTLFRKNIQILVNGADKTDDFKTPGGSSWTAFSAGDSLISSLPYVYGTGIQVIHTASNNPTVIETLYSKPAILKPKADFTFAPDFGYAPLKVFFEDLSSKNPASWYWEFGDNLMSSVRNPVHIYNNSGFYEIKLTVCNEGGCSDIMKYLMVFGFSDFIVNEGVVLYGSQLSFAGNNLMGPGLTMVIQGGLTTDDMNRGSSVDVSTVYIDGPVILDGGSAGIGSASDPGAIYVNGDMVLGSGGRDIYGDLYIDGNFYLKDAKIHGDVYVNGDLTLDWTPSLDADSRIYYNGAFTHPPSMSSSITGKCIYQSSIPGFTVPDVAIPSVKSDDFYASRGYVSGGSLAAGTKIFAESYLRQKQKDDYAENIIIIAKSGDISLTGFGGDTVTGVLFAPNGKVTFEGNSFEGVVIARDGFEVISGGTKVLFRNLNYYISDPDDYPF